MTDPVVLMVPRDKYKFMLKTIDEQKTFIYKLKMHPLVKQEALRGLRILSTILTNNEKKGVCV